MKAIGYQKSLSIDHPEALVEFETEKPEPKGLDLLVKVEAISVNPVDTKIRQRISPENGEYKILGWDVAGTVEAVGDEVTLFKPGDEVWYAGALDRPGANSEYHLVDERIVGRKPVSLNFTQAAALPLTTITAWEMLFDRFGLNWDSQGRLLIIGAAGGVGSIMIQLAKKLTQLDVIGTASRDSSREWISSLGIDYLINHNKPFKEELATLGISDVDYIASLTNTDKHIDSIIEHIAPEGHFGLIDDPGDFSIMPFKQKSVSIHWEFMFTRSLFKTKTIKEQHILLNKVAGLFDDSEKPKMQSTFNESYGTISAENLIMAHKLIESGKAVGKIVLAGFDK